MTTPNSNHSNNEKTLAQILSKFDEEDKKLLALELVKEFNLQTRGESYSKQLKLILTRDLTDDENFKVEILDRMLRFHGGGGGGGRGGGGRVFGVKGIYPAPKKNARK